MSEYISLNGGRDLQVPEACGRSRHTGQASVNRAGVVDRWVRGVPVITILIVLCLVGFVLWLINTYGTMIDAKIKTIINVVAVIAVILWLLRVFGLWGGITDIKV